VGDGRRSTHHRFERWRQRVPGARQGRNSEGRRLDGQEKLDVSRLPAAVVGV
jgi:hypothetical protein